MEGQSDLETIKVRNRECMRVSPAKGAGTTLWITGLPGAGKSALAAALEQTLNDKGHLSYQLDGDVLRRGINRDLGFSKTERDENVRRTSEIAALFADAGLIAIVALISPYRAARDQARTMHRKRGLGFHEIYLDTPLDECVRRDAKGHYARARSGDITRFTGIDDPYEEPLNPDLRIFPHSGPPAIQARVVIESLNIAACT